MIRLAQVELRRCPYSWEVILEALWHISGVIRFVHKTFPRKSKGNAVVLFPDGNSRRATIDKLTLVESLQGHISNMSRH